MGSPIERGERALRITNALLTLDREVRQVGALVEMEQKKDQHLEAYSWGDPNDETRYALVSAAATVRFGRMLRRVREAING